MEQKSNYLYQAFYCEENIWQLAKQRKEDEAEVWFIINPTKTVATAMQKAAGDQPLVVWDYHVIYYSPQQGVFDLDTLCNFPCSVDDYLQQSFLDYFPYLGSEYHPYFRVLGAQQYLQLFASNRGHMKDENGNFLEPPPGWPTIGKGHNLEAFTDYDSKKIGEIFNIEALKKRLLLD